MGADEDVDAAGGQVLEDGALRGGGAKAGENLDAYGKGGEAGAEGFFVLLREDGGGDQHRRLLPGGGNPEGGADGDFGLPVADIADDDAVHGAGAGLVGADGLGGGGLIGRFNEGEGGFQLHMPRTVGRDGDPGRISRAA